MTRILRRKLVVLRDDRVVDLLGGTWLVALVIGLLNLPALML